MYAVICCLFPCQVLTLRLLRAIAPSWKAGHNMADQKQLVDDLFCLLGEVLVLCNSPFLKPSSKSETGHTLLMMHVYLRCIYLHRYVLI